jgi:hypothetical protein
VFYTSTREFAELYCRLYFLIIPDILSDILDISYTPNNFTKAKYLARKPLLKSLDLMHRIEIID